MVSRRKRSVFAHATGKFVAKNKYLLLPSWCRPFGNLRILPLEVLLIVFSWRMRDVFKLVEFLIIMSTCYFMSVHFFFLTHCCKGQWDFFLQSKASQFMVFAISSSSFCDQKRLSEKLRISSDFISRVCGYRRTRSFCKSLQWLVTLNVNIVPWVPASISGRTRTVAHIT